MHAQKLIVFKHVGIGTDEKQKMNKQSRCAPARKLFDLVSIKRCAGKEGDEKECSKITEKPCSFEDIKKLICRYKI